MKSSIHHTTIHLNSHNLIECVKNITSASQLAKLLKSLHPKRRNRVVHALKYSSHLSTLFKTVDDLTVILGYIKNKEINALFRTLQYQISKLEFPDHQAYQKILHSKHFQLTETQETFLLLHSNIFTSCAPKTIEHINALFKWSRPNTQNTLLKGFGTKIIQAITDEQELKDLLNVTSKQNHILLYSLAREKFPSFLYYGPYSMAYENGYYQGKSSLKPKPYYTEFPHLKKYQDNQFENCDSVESAQHLFYLLTKARNENVLNQMTGPLCQKLPTLITTPKEVAILFSLVSIIEQVLVYQSLKGHFKTIYSSGVSIPDYQHALRFMQPNVMQFLTLIKDSIVKEIKKSGNYDGWIPQGVNIEWYFKNLIPSPYIQAGPTLREQFNSMVADMQSLQSTILKSLDKMEKKKKRTKPS